MDSNESLRNKNLAAELEVHKTLLNSMLPPLTCQICLFLMHRPFALAPCGHTACHTCLVSWFSSHPAQEGQAPAPAVPNAQVPANPLPNDIVDNNNANPQNAPLPPADLRAIMRRKKTCPHCRAIVRERPAEVWAIKDMVLNVVKSGLIDNELVPPTLQHELDTGEEVRGDPWTNIFPSARSVPLDGFQGLDEREHMGIIDLEDGGVYRCIDCAHEIEDGICTGCERIYPGHGWGSDSESDDEVFPYNLPRVVWRGPGSFFGDNWRDIDIDDVGGDTEVEENEDVEVGLEIDSDDSHDDDESDSSENSFIVGDDTDVEIGDGPHNAGRGYRNNQPPIRWVISSDDETMDGHDLHDDEVVEVRVPSRVSRVSRIVISSDSGSDQESEYDIQSVFIPSHGFSVCILIGFSSFIGIWQQNEQRAIGEPLLSLIFDS